MALIQADTQPIAVFGATSDVSTTVTLALPTGVVPIGAGTIDVTVKIDPVTETRTFAAGLRLDGTQPGLDYAVSPDRVVLTLFGSITALDRLGSAPIVVGLNVSALGIGAHDVPVVPSLPSGVTVAAISSQTVTVTISAPASSPSPSASGSSASPSPAVPLTPGTPAPPRCGEEQHEKPVRHGRHPRRGQRRPATVAGVRARSGDGPPGDRPRWLARGGAGYAAVG